MFRYAKEFEKKLKILNPKKTKKALHLSGVKNYKKSRLEIIDKSIEGFSKI
ncbi:hypothetical protein JIY74_29515 [Vibrio harveyi]|nr:hypothetical protein [Vibrio harveyi]